MTDKNQKADATQDSLVDALESIKELLAKSDSKLSAARESIALASSKTRGSTKHEESGQYEIPVLDDIVIPAEIESATEAVSQISEKIDQTLAAVTETSAKTDPQQVIAYIDSLQKALEKAIRDSMMKSVVTIEKGLKKTIADEMDKIRKQIKKDFK